MKRAVFFFLLITALMTQISFADAGRGEEKSAAAGPSGPETASAQPAAAPVEKKETVFLDEVFVKDGALYVKANPIEWYEGKEADEKFREIEQDPEMTEAPDGYYIVDKDPYVNTLQVAPDAEVYMQIYNRTGNADEADIVWNEHIALDKFTKLLTEDTGMDMKWFPYHLVIRDGKVVKITQQYIP